MYELTELMASLRRRRKQALILFLVFAIVGAAGVLLWPPSYVTTSQVLIKRPDTREEPTMYPAIDALLTWNRETAMETYIAMALRPSIAQNIIQQLGLRTTVKKFLKLNLSVTPVTHADIMDIAVSWKNRQMSATIANAYANEFVAEQRDLVISQASQASASLAIALRKAQSDLGSAENALTLFESRHEIADSSTQTSSIIAAIGDVQSKERVIDAERVQAEGQLASMTGAIGAAPATIDAGTVISSSPASERIAEQLSQQQVQLHLLRQQFTEKYPDVIATERQIAGLQATLAKTPATQVTSKTVQPNPLSSSLVSQAATLKAQVTGNIAQLDLLRSQELALRNQLRDFPANLTELASLQRQAKSAETIYNQLQTNYFNALVAKSMAVSELSVISQADPSLAKVRPPLALSLLAVAVFAILATVAIVTLLEWLAVSTLAYSEAR